MYLRITKRTNKDGSVVEYFQLAHNERHPDTRKPVAKIIHNFGRVDQLDRQELVRLCQSIGRVCGLRFDDPQATIRDSAIPVGLPADMKIKQTLALGCPLVIDALWERLGLKKCLESIEQAAGGRAQLERALLAMVANRLCLPEGKLGVWDRWLSTVYLPSSQGLKLRHMYEAMDLLHANSEEVEKTVFFNTANLFNLEVDLIFYDTTTASFHVDYEDDETDPDSNTTLRKPGTSKGFSRFANLLAANARQIGNGFSKKMVMEKLKHIVKRPAMSVQLGSWQILKPNHLLNIHFLLSGEKGW